MIDILMIPVELVRAIFAVVRGLPGLVVHHPLPALAVLAVVGLVIAISEHVISHPKD